jgi:glutathione S-transferase
MQSQPDTPSDLTLTIGEKNISSWSMRAFLALAVKGLAFEERTISLGEDRDRSRRFAASPVGTVPVLQHGPLVIPDSLAIIEYLEETFPPPRFPALWPADPHDRAHARWLSATMHSSFSTLRQEMSFNLCFLAQRPSVSPTALQEAAHILSLWESALAHRRPSGPFLFGAFGAADAMYAPAVVRLRAFAVPTTETPRAAEYMEAVLESPLVRRWMDPARALPPVASY